MHRGSFAQNVVFTVRISCLTDVKFQECPARCRRTSFDFCAAFAVWKFMFFAIIWGEGLVDWWHRVAPLTLLCSCFWCDSRSREFSRSAERDNGVHLLLLFSFSWCRHASTVPWQAPRIRPIRSDPSAKQYGSSPPASSSNTEEVTQCWQRCGTPSPPASEQSRKLFQKTQKTRKHKKRKEKKQQSTKNSWPDPDDPIWNCAMHKKVPQSSDSNFSTVVAEVLWESIIARSSSLTVAETSWKWHARIRHSHPPAACVRSTWPLVSRCNEHDTSFSQLSAQRSDLPTGPKVRGPWPIASLMNCANHAQRVEWICPCICAGKGDGVSLSFSPLSLCFCIYYLSLSVPLLLSLLSRAGYVMSNVVSCHL